MIFPVNLRSGGLKRFSLATENVRANGAVAVDVAVDVAVVPTVAVAVAESSLSEV